MFSVPQSTETKANEAARAAFEWLNKFEELSEAVSYRPLRERLIEIGQIVAEIATNLRQDPEDIRVLPLFVSYLDRIADHVSTYNGAQIDFADDPNSINMRSATQKTMDSVFTAFKEAKQAMLANDYFSLRVGNRALSKIFDMRLES